MEKFSAYGFKYNPKKAKVKCPLTFSNNYPEIPFSVVTKDNYMEFITGWLFLIGRLCEVIDSVAEEFIKLILTLDDDPPGDYNGITRMNALDWLMGD